MTVFVTLVMAPISCRATQGCLDCTADVSVVVADEILVVDVSTVTKALAVDSQPQISVAVAIMLVLDLEPTPR